VQYKDVSMSYQYKRADICVVVCDTCGDFSWVSDNRWHEMPHGSSAAPIHLCQACRRHALWCSAHQQYHLPDTFHRQHCRDCGGLFTSVARDRLTRCPSCRRAAGEDPAPIARPVSSPPRSLLQRLLMPLR
jgi:protein-arginine kinase activator protein McsA